jgi:hypothetical protein
MDPDAHPGGQKHTDPDADRNTAIVGHQNAGSGSAIRKNAGSGFALNHCRSENLIRTTGQK